VKLKGFWYSKAFDHNRKIIAVSPKRRFCSSLGDWELEKYPAINSCRGHYKVNGG